MHSLSGRPFATHAVPASNPYAIRAFSRICGLALALTMALPLAARAEAPFPQISVSGEGVVQSAPDMATISLGVTTQGATAAEAMAANSAEVAKVLANLTAAGIEGRDIQTTGLSLNPVWSNYDSVQKIDSYQAVNSVTVRVRALDALGGVLDAAVKDGANTLNGLTFGLADPAPALDEARKRAVADATRKATILAEAAGVKLGRVLNITEGAGYASPAPMFRAEASMKDAVPVAGGEVAMQVSVTILYAIE